ncbi:MAG: sulfite oxidase-like oxidoreductase [Acidimicrobiia bacterium]|nr:sulfite oxidase-like oxidoreductase [Acidimicrobiia bacterium]
MSSFFERNRAKLADLGIDPDRLPPGQYHTERFPVLHAGSVPAVDLDSWDLAFDGLVSEERTWDWESVISMPTTETITDIHCVTKWTKFDTVWEGIPTRTFAEAVSVRPEATHVLVSAYHGYTANLPLEDFLAPTSMFAHTYQGEPLEPDHGYPLRLLVPHLYFWKSVKWVRGVTFLSEDSPGFWERNGYHMYGDPFREQRYWGD